MELRPGGLSGAGLFRWQNAQEPLTVRRDVEAPQILEGKEIADGNLLFRAER